MAITITVNGKEISVPKHPVISYTELCRLANVDVKRQPLVSYFAGPLTAGNHSVGEEAPLRRLAHYIVSTR
jgi:hypothetical protein